MADGVGDIPKAGERPDRVVIKKYANRRLYNTSSSTYVTLDHLSELVRGGQDFVVFDARTGEDITRQVLTQIIFEEETRGQNLLPVTFLRQLITMYGDQMHALMAPAYLEASLDAFTRQQALMREQWASFAGAGAAAAKPENGAAKSPFEEQIRANMALFENAMKMFNPFGIGVPGGAAAKPATPEPAPEAAPAPVAEGAAMAEMRRRLEEMQAQIERLAARG